MNNQDGVQDESFTLIAKECVHLEELSLDQCSSLTSMSLMYLGELRHLKRLTLSGVGNVDDIVCQQISRCSMLKFLDLNFCKKVNKRNFNTHISSNFRSSDLVCNVFSPA